MKKSNTTLNVLHLASFSGNIGDLANHTGARRLFDDNLPFDLNYTNLEIREFYWGHRSFDSNFANYANDFDLLIIGGGNYFELWVEHSSTGTSIDISPSILSMITVPTLFFALGVDIGMGYSDSTVANFKSFISTVLDRKDMFVCVRNDGSSSSLNHVLGDSISSRIPIMPDGGFFAYKTKSLDNFQRVNSIGVNIAGDMLERRFESNFNAQDFLSELSASFVSILDSHPELSITLMPHIWRDVQFISELLNYIPDHYLRRRLVIGCLTPNWSGINDFLETYFNFDVVLGMRFHANVCPISMAVPTIGLCCYPQVTHLYNELGLNNRLISVNTPGFSNQIVDQLYSDFNNMSELSNVFGKRVSILNAQASDCLMSISTWLQTVC